MNRTTSDQPDASIQSVMQVQTLGRFDVKKSHQSLVDASAGSRKIWELFKFMMTHRHRSFTPESLLDSLWSSEDYSDPRSTLRRQMHRLRQVLCEQDNAADAEISILYHNGYYRWNPERQAIIDADQFETAVKMGDSMKIDLPLKALSHYQTALHHYQGDYLPECFDQQWVFPVRNHYRRLYLKTVLSVSDLLKDQRQFSEIIKISEKAIELDIYEEEFHLRFMDALLNLGERKQALEHYEYITGFFYQEMGIKPSPAFKNIYKKMLSSQPTLDSMEALQADLDGSDPFENAFFCSAEVFRSIYELERRRSERSGVKAVIGMITLDQPHTASHGQQQQRMQAFQQHVLRQLRKGDTVTRWNDSQFLVLLPGLDTETMDKVLNRVVQQFPHETPEGRTHIKANCQLILPPQAAHNLVSSLDD
jgi:DNA-binding SARP family transcriptional activator